MSAALVKITCLIDYLEPGGAQRQLVSLGLFLKRMGHDVSFVTYHDGEFFQRQLEQAGIPIRRVRPRHKLLRAIAIRKALRFERPHAVLAFLEGPCFYAEIASLPFRRWGLVVSERLQIHAKKPPRDWKRVMHLRADYVTTNSHANRLALERMVPSLGGRVATIYNCLDLSAFCPSEASPTPTPDTIKLVVMASYLRRKNTLGLAKALALAREKDPGLKIEVDWYGGDPVLLPRNTPDTVYRDSAQSVIDQLGLSRVFRLHPPENDIVRRYQAADAVVLPSFAEGLPNAVCEGMACGRPVLASDIGDAPRLVEPGRNGFLFNPAMAESIAGAILAFCHLPAGRRVAMGVESRRMAELLFAPERAAAAYAELLEAALSQRRIAVRHWPSPPAGADSSMKVRGPVSSRSAGTSAFKFAISLLHRWGLLVGRACARLQMLMYRPLFASYGRNFRFDPGGDYSYRTIHVGNDVHLGRRPTLQAVHSKILIGNKVIFGPEVAIHGGNHTSTLLGRYIHDVREKEKRPEDDADVVIEDDVWVGTRAIILKGVTIHRGAIIGAGAVVTRDVPPYAIAAGVPARVVRFRWTPEMILRHEALLYPAERRLARKAIEEEARRCGWLNK